MNYLINYAREGGLDEVVNFALENERVHGIAVGLDPFWLYCWQIAQTRGHTANDRFWTNSYKYSPSRFRDFFLYFEKEESPVIFETIMPKMDLNWYPPRWFDFDLPKNIIVKIHLEPGAPPINIDRFNSNERFQFVTTLEYRPRAEFSSDARSLVRPLKGGISIGQGLTSSGTLGGILTDRSSKKKYAITCGHVLENVNAQADQPSQYDNQKQSHSIGTCVLSHFPSPNKMNNCSMFKTTNGIDMDLALIELNSDIDSIPEIIDIGWINGYTQKENLISGLTVEIHGRSSSYKKLRLGDAIIVKRIKKNGKNYCFKNLIQVNAPSFRSLLFHRPVSPGDSGAWLCAQGDGTEWSGMIIAQDRLSGYAICSEDILTWLRDKGYNMSCSSI